jgi:DNA-binding NarL/FixJ family response regulator
MNKIIRLAIVDDHPIMREGIAATLSGEADLVVVASGGSAEDAISIAGEFNPDVMVLDVHMPGGGVEAARHINAGHPHIKLLFLTVSENQEDVAAALAAGVSGYILKGVRGDDLSKTIRLIAAGETYITPAFAARLLSAPRDSARGEKAHLSAREEQILHAVSLGLKNKEIGEKFNLTEKTVKHYMSIILNKLSARNRVEALVASKRMKLLDS